MTSETVICALCGVTTRMLGTMRCDSCWELEGRIRAAPELAQKVLDWIAEEEDTARRQDFYRDQHPDEFA